MMVRYAQVEEGATFPVTPAQDPEKAEKEKEKEEKEEETEEDPILACLYKMSFGPAQLYVYALAWVAAILCAPVYVDYIFLGKVVRARCRVPSCDTNETKYNESFVDWAIPEDDQCHVRRLYDDTNSTECDADAFTNYTNTCSDWIYDDSLFSSTTVTEFDLVCDKSWMGPLAGSMYMLGMLIGAITIGDLADRYGRKVGILVSVVLLGGGGVLSAVSPNYTMFLIMRLLTGAGGVGLFQVTFVLAVEFIGAKWRTFVGIIIEVPFALGEAMTGVFAIFIRDWRGLQVAVTAPAFLLLTYMWLMPESVRWLVSQGRRADAIKIINRAAKVNGVEVPKHLLEDTNTEVPTIDGTISVTNSKDDLVKGVAGPLVKKTVLDLLRTPNMRKRSFNMFFCWAVCTLVYYGLSSNSGNLGGNIFVNFIATMLIEIPSYIFSYLVLDRMGRKGTLTFVLLLGGGACFISGFIPKGLDWLTVTLSLVGKFGIAAAFAIVYVYSAEIFPTEYRSVGIGACSMCARIGGIIAPFISSLAEIYQPLPLIIFGVLSIISGALIVFLPETVGCELPQTLQESEDFGKDQSIWYFSCCKSRKNNLSGEVNEGLEEQKI